MEAAQQSTVSAHPLALGLLGDPSHSHFLRVALGASALHCSELLTQTCLISVQDEMGPNWANKRQA